MAKKMLIDATHPEETRVVVVDGNKVDDFDFESINKRQLAGNIYLAKVTRVEPSLQAAFVDYGGNRHGFLAFAEIHPDYYQIPVADRQALLREEARAQREAAEDEDPDSARNRARRGRNKREGGRDGGRDADREGRRDSNREPRGGASAQGAPAEIAGFAVIEPDADEAGGDEDHAALALGSAAPAPAGVEAAPAAAEPAASPADDDSPDGDAAHADAPDAAAQAGGASAAPDDGDTAGEDASTPSPRSIAEDTGLDSDTESVSEPIGATDDAGSDAAPADGSRPKPRRRRRRAKPGRDDTASPSGEAAGPAAATDDDDTENTRVDEATVPEEVDSIGSDDTREEEAEARAHRRRRYRIQDVVKVRQIMLVQVVKEERGNKGAALTTYLSLAGRYCVLMPNTARGGGISRKIVSAADRKRLREIVAEFDVPEGMGLIVRTAGAERTRPEIKRDYEFLLRQWEQVRELTLKSTAPCLIYEEGSLIKRTIRDIYSKDIDAILVEGEGGYREAKDYMKMLMPSHAKNVQLYAETVPLFIRYQVESYLNGMFSPVVQLKSGGYIVIGITEALVAIDVNSGRSTREGSIEETATKTNLEAADEVARQLRLRDLAGLIVIDFIDMEDSRNIRAVEKRMKERLKNDRARIQVGRISGFGLMEMSRQRLRPGMLEATTQPCPHCHGQGIIRSDENMALAILREIEEEGVRARSAEVGVTVPVEIANYLINYKRRNLASIEERYGMVINVFGDATLLTPNYKIDRSKTQSRAIVTIGAPAISAQSVAQDYDLDEFEDEDEAEAVAVEVATPAAPAPAARPAATAPAPSGDETDGKGAKRRRRGKRGGRRRRPGAEGGEAGSESRAETTEPIPTPAPAADEPAAAGAPLPAEPEAASEFTQDAGAVPKKRRPRKRKADLDTAAETVPAEIAPAEIAPAEIVPAETAPAGSVPEAPAESVAEAPAPKAPAKRRRTAKPKAAGAETAEVAVPSAEEAPEPASMQPAAPESTATEPEADTQSAPIPPVPPAAAAERPEEPEAAPASTPAQAATSPAAPEAPKRRGWWSLR